MNRDDLVNLIPAYVLGALDPEEHVEFTSWLQTDPEAQTLLTEYQTIAGQLVVLAPARPVPDHLQADLRRRLAASRLPSAAPPAVPPAEPAAETRVPGGLKRWLKRPVFRYGLAAAVLVVLALAAFLVRQANRSEPFDAADMFEEMAVRPGSTWYTVEPAVGQDALSGVLCVSSSGDQAVIRVEQLPVLDADHTFQLWLLDTKGTVHSGGLFQREGRDQPTYIDIPLEGPISGYQRFGASIEPAGGSPKPDGPTGPGVFRVPLTNYENSYEY